MPVDASSLYRDQVLEHGRAPRGSGRLADPALRATAHNRLCGDRVELSLHIDGEGGILALMHESEGCLLCLASVSLMATHLPGLHTGDAAEQGRRLRACLASGDADGLGPFVALAGVSPHPARHRCVLLAWDALQAALVRPVSPA